MKQWAAKFYVLSWVGILIGIIPSLSWALEGTDTLPQGIYSPSIATGMISGLGNRFTETGELVSQGDFRSIDLDSKRLSEFSEDYEQLVQVLDSFGHFQLGQQLNPGRIRVDLDPSVRFMAPNLAYGISDRWTVAAVVPIVEYRNRVTITQTNSNVDEIRKEVEGGSEELDAAFDQLSTDLAQQLKTEVTNSGYRSLDQRDETIVGDIQLLSLYRFFENTNWAMSVQNILNLPTGQQQDPNDLLSLDLFGRTSFSNDILLSRKINSDLTVTSYVGYEYFIPDSVNRRVPRDSGDLLPPPSQLASVSRRIGGLFTVGANLFYQLSSSMSSGIDLVHNNKARDQFDGGVVGDYGALAQFTDSSWTQATFQLQYSTIEAFKRKEFMIPFMIIYNYGNVFQAINREQQKIHMLNLRMFFK